MLAALRPGGLLVVEDIDFHGSYCHPFTDEWSRYEEIFTQTAVLSAAIPLRHRSAGACSTPGS